MKTNELELYYFGEAQFQKIREKHLSNLKEIIGVKELLNNQDLTDDEFEHKQRHIFDEIYKYISSNKRIRRDFYNAYGVVLIDTLCQFVLESLIADEVIKNNLKEYKNKGVSNCFRNAFCCKIVNFILLYVTL